MCTQDPNPKFKAMKMTRDEAIKAMRAGKTVRNVNWTLSMQDGELCGPAGLSLSTYGLQNFLAPENDVGWEIVTQKKTIELKRWAVVHAKSGVVRHIYKDHLAAIEDVEYINKVSNEKYGLIELSGSVEVEV